jgi:transposase
MRMVRFLIKCDCIKFGQILETIICLEGVTKREEKRNCNKLVLNRKRLSRERKPVMAKPIVSDELWEIVQPLLPPPKPRRKRFPGRQPIDDRKALTGILFILKTGTAWADLPREMGCGSGMTCWRRLRDWQAAGVWAMLHQVMLSLLHGEGKLDWSRALVDSSSVRAVLGGPKLARIQPIAPKQGRNITS